MVFVCLGATAQDGEGLSGLVATLGLHSCSFLGFRCRILKGSPKKELLWFRSRILKGNPKKELLWSLWVGPEV